MRCCRASRVSSTGTGQGGGVVCVASFLCRKWNVLRRV